MNRFLLIALLLVSTVARAQTDTIRVNARSLNTAAWRDGKRSYAVYFEDSTSRRLSSADIWDRTLRQTTQNGQRQYTFVWDWYRRDSLLAHVTTTGQWPSLAPLTHEAVYAKRGSRSFVFQKDVVTMPDSARHTAKDSAFRVTMQPPAFAFPMDLEILPLLPLRKVGQTFAVPFYEPGSPAAAYYKLSVIGREPLPIVGKVTVDCWLVRIDYAPGSCATFWISDQPREVIKMKEYFRGRYRYKVKLY
ncbi:hypothetical protein FAES_0402 [Fibrella aestuarina BUZ 2]|uniref:DUF3108 domain-containing protein n=1 Tax=Fibrella aestuarina BUZ 2 TaxID=1166018 RepID=I0K2R1_9BACT|nr:hypothetical protein [Fibrella aestuarina]CCG98414.1 hypothetical protein FAES_0402 [Fibrella aestuarina BUZ 2]